MEGGSTGIGLRSALGALIALMALALAGPTNAGAATTIGSTFTPTDSCPMAPTMSGPTTATFIQSTSPSGLYEAPTAGVITSWSYQAPTDGSPLVIFVVARRTATADQFAVIASTGLKPTTAGTLSTYTDISVPVQAGDLIGVRVNGAQRCGDTTPGPGYVAHYGSSFGVGTNQYPFTTPVRLDVSATLEADQDGDGLGDETEDADDDNDAINDATDNCAAVANADQANLDGDGQGDVCDADDDNDGVADASDQCPRTRGVSSNAGCPDNDAPDTVIKKGPRKRTFARQATFRFRSTEAGSTFRCKLDRGPFRRCRSPKTYTVKPGRHTFKVKAVDQAGNADPIAAVFRWRVRRRSG